ncbi:MAG: hypothetical protein ACK4L4_07740 [Gemmobacter sp.]
MTTEVIIKANHGWPVQVLPLPVGGSAVGPMRVVEPGQTCVFHVHSGQDLLIHETQPAETLADSGEPILQFFAFAHLPEQLQIVSRPFAEMAQRIMTTLPRNAERSVALRKLLEAKDSAVRASVAS